MFWRDPMINRTRELLSERNEQITRIARMTINYHRSHMTVEVLQEVLLRARDMVVPMHNALRDGREV
mgnify:CR=1 FL=1